MYWFDDGRTEEVCDGCQRKTVAWENVYETGKHWRVLKCQNKSCGRVHGRTLSIGYKGVTPMDSLVGVM